MVVQQEHSPTQMQKSESIVLNIHNLIYKNTDDNYHHKLLKMNFVKLEVEQSKVFNV